MEAQEMKIVPPEGYEIDKKNSTFECIKFKPKALTYKDVRKAIFENKDAYFMDENNRIRHMIRCSTNSNLIFATSEKQLKKLVAINKLMNIAKYLNGDWKPDWNDMAEWKWRISIKPNNDIEFFYSDSNKSFAVYFKTKELAQQAIDILGEDTIRLALSTDW